MSWLGPERGGIIQLTKYSHNAHQAVEIEFCVRHCVQYSDKILKLWEGGGNNFGLLYTLLQPIKADESNLIDKGGCSITISSIVSISGHEGEQVFEGCAC